MEQSSKRRKLEHREQAHDDEAAQLPSITNRDHYLDESELGSESVEEETSESVEEEKSEEVSEEVSEEGAEEFSDSSSYISSTENEGSENEGAACRRYEQRAQARRDAKDRAQAQAYDKDQEIKVQKAQSDLEAALKKDPKPKSIPIGPVIGGRWNLHSAVYINHFYVLEKSSSHIRFGEFDHDLLEDLCDEPSVVCKPDEISGELNVYPRGHFEVFPSKWPKHASLDPITIRTDEGHEMEVVFLGNGFLKLKVELDLLLKGESTGSQMIEFSGIFDSDKERKRRREEWYRAQVSPRESMASLNGWY